jgi:putative phosphoesterase
MATTRILLVGDTHAYTWDELHPRLREAVAEADIAVHAGDIVRLAVTDRFSEVARRSYVVHGNSDPAEIRRALPYREYFEVDGLRIGLTHPSWAGPEFEPEVLLRDFPEGVDVILYGHLHETVNETRKGVLFLNGGQAYPSFLVRATVAWLIIEDGVPRGEIEEIAPAE